MHDFTFYVPFTGEKYHTQFAGCSPRIISVAKEPVSMLKVISPRS